MREGTKGKEEKLKGKSCKSGEREKCKEQDRIKGELMGRFTRLHGLKWTLCHTRVN